MFSLRRGLRSVECCSVYPSVDISYLHVWSWSLTRVTISFLVTRLDNNKQQIKLRWALFATYTIIQSIMRSEMCSLHLTHPWSSGQPTMQRPGSSRGLSAGAEIWTHNLRLPLVSSPTLYPLGHDCPLGQDKALLHQLVSLAGRPALGRVQTSSIWVLLKPLYSL